MFLAIWAFVLQGTLISISQAKAAAGSMSEPAVTLSGSVHFHDQLAGHVHDHGGDSAEGHIHDGPDHDNDGGLSQSWSLFGPSIDVPAYIAFSRSFDVLGLVEPLAYQVADGVEPSGLIRPPSTLSIA